MIKLKIIPSCKEASRLLSEQLDHPIPLFKRVLLKMHLNMCVHCVQIGQQIKSLKKLIGMHEIPEEQQPSPYTTNLSDTAVENIKSSIRELNS